MLKELILRPDKNMLYHGSYKNIQYMHVLGLNNNINVSYVTPNRKYAERYGDVITLTPTRKLKILVLSKEALEKMLPMVPNTRIGNNMIKAMRAKHDKAKIGCDDATINRCIDKKIKNAMETATYRNLLKSKPIKITNNGYIRNSDEMLDLAIYSMLTRIAKKMGYDGIKTVTSGTVKNSNNVHSLPTPEIVFPGQAPLRVVNRNANKPVTPPDHKPRFIQRIKNQGPDRFATTIKYNRISKKQFLSAFNLPPNTNILSFAKHLNKLS